MDSYLVIGPWRFHSRLVLLPAALNELNLCAQFLTQAPIAFSDFGDLSACLSLFDTAHRDPWPGPCSRCAAAREELRGRPAFRVAAALSPECPQWCDCLSLPRKELSR